MLFPLTYCLRSFRWFLSCNKTASIGVFSDAKLFKYYFPSMLTICKAPWSWDWQCLVANQRFYRLRFQFVQSSVHPSLPDTWQVVTLIRGCWSCIRSCIIYYSWQLEQHPLLFSFRDIYLLGYVKDRMRVMLPFPHASRKWAMTAISKPITAGALEIKSVRGGWKLTVLWVTAILVNQNHNGVKDSDEQ